MGSRPSTSAQRALFQLLAASRGKVIEENAILSVTGWMSSTWKSYLAKGHYAAYLTKSPGGFFVAMRHNVDETSFLRQVSQSVNRREMGALLKPLASALVRKARDNMTLALELYNRPSLENRLDAFTMLFCTAWEQLLKAEIVDADGEAAIFRPTKEGKRPETLSLEQAIEARIGPSGSVRENLLVIAELRHGATHLLMPETQAVLSRLFQAGVLNFSRRYQRLAGHALFGPRSSGLLSLVAEREPVDAVALKQTYGEVAGSDIAAFIHTLEAELVTRTDQEFAVSVEYKLVLTKRDADGDIRLTTSPDAATTVLVVEKPVSVNDRYRFNSGDLAKHLSSKIGKSFNAHDVQALVFKQGWKTADNEFHCYQPRPNLHWYSDKAADSLTEMIERDSGYLLAARASYGASLKKKKR